MKNDTTSSSLLPHFFLTSSSLLPHSCKFVILLSFGLLLASSSLLLADPAPSFLLQGEEASYDGWLISQTRAANLISTIEVAKKLLLLEEGRARDLEELYQDALGEQVLLSTAAILEASSRTWWERWGAVTLGGAGGVVLGMGVARLLTAW